MGTRPVEMGTTGELVRRRIAELRSIRRLTLAQLSARMTDVGRPMMANGIWKIEHGERRVDVDDLTALASALGVDAAVLIDPTPINVTMDSVVVA